MADHFTLDVDPAELRKAATDLETLRTNVMAKGRTVTGTPAEIGDGWTGDAATAVKDEMDTLGGRMVGLGGFLFPISEGLRELARTYDAALEELPGLNQRWNAAQTTYDDAVTASQNRMARDRETLGEGSGGLSGVARQETQTEHSSRVTEAGTTLAGTQDTIQGEYDEIVAQLERDTTALGTVLNDQTPVDVTAEQIEAWQSGSWPEPDMDNLLIGLGLMTSRSDQEAEEAVQPDLDRLNEALEGDDPEAVNEALEALGENAEDPAYSRALVRMLGPDGVTELHENVEDFSVMNYVTPGTLSPGLLALGDTLAHGVSQLPDGDGDADFAAWTEALTSTGMGRRIVGVLAASEHADGRLNALAMAHHTGITYTGPGGSTAPHELFPQLLWEAYPDQDMLDHWAERATGDDLTRILEHSDPERVDELMALLMLSQDGAGHTMPREDYQHIADLWGSTVESLRGDFTTAGDDEHPLNTLMQVLNARRGVSDYNYQEMLTPYLEDVVNDSALMDQILTDVDDNRFGEDSGSQLKNLIQDSGVSVDTILQGIVDHQIASGNSAQSVAKDIGVLLATSDIMDGQDLDWAALTQSATQSLLNVAATAGELTFAGPVIGFLGALVDEAERQQALEDGWNSQLGNNTPQEVIAFTLFVQDNGLPEGFEEYLAEQGDNVDNPDEVVTRFLDKMEEDGHPDWGAMDDVVSTLNATRDDR